MRTYPKLLTVALLLTITMSVVAQNSPWVREVNIEDRIANNKLISFIREDKNGLLWIAYLNGGLTSFDGSNFKTLNTPNVKGYLIKLHEDVDGKMVLQNNYGELFYLENGIFKEHIANKKIDELNPRGKAYWTVVEENTTHFSIPISGYVIIDSLGSATYPFKEKKVTIEGLGIIFRTDKEPIIIKHIDQDKKASPLRHISLLNENFNVLDTLGYTPPNFEYPFSYTILANGNYLISATGIFFECNKNKILRIINYETTVSGVLADSKGGLWVSTEKGLHYYPDGNIDSNSRITVIENDFCVVREEDYQGGIWIHSDKKGLLQIPFQQYSHFHEKNFLKSNAISIIFSYYDTTFLGYKDGSINYIDPLDNESKNLYLSPRVGKLNDFTDAYVKEKDKKIWLSQRGRLLYRVNGTIKTIQTNAMDKDDIYSKFYLRDSDWKKFELAGFHKQQYFLGNEDSIEYISEKFPEPIQSILVLKDSVFVGTSDGFYLKTGGKLIALHKLYPSINGRVTHMEYFDSKIWVYSKSDGSFVLTEDGPNQLRWKAKQMFDILEVHKQDKKHLWFIGSEYNFRYSPSDNDSIELERIAPMPPFSDGRIFFSDKSCYAVNNQKGVLKVDFSELANYRPPPLQLYLNEVKFDKHKSSTEDSVLHTNYKNNSIQISYSAINFTDYPINYRYRFGKSTAKWQHTSDNELLLLGLSPGSYEFELQGRLGEEPWSPVKRLRLIITPPIWQENWFIFLILCTLLFLTYLVLRYRFRQVKHQNKLVVEHLLSEQRALRAKLDPHFVFNIISSAQSLILRESKEKAAHFLQLFSKQLRNVLDQSDKTNNTLSNEIIMLKEYVDLEYYRLGESFDYTTHVDNNIQIEQEKILPLIIQPFIENAILHGLRLKKTRGKLQVIFTIERDFLKIIIEDNGIGRTAAKRMRTVEKIKQQSHGISICKERLELHNKSTKHKAVSYIDLKNNKGTVTGTRVIIYMKRLKK